MYSVLKRLFDLSLGLTIFVLCIPILLILWVFCKLTDPGPFLHWSKRVGVNSTIFLMPKIRTMKLNTPQVATHLLSDSGQYLTRMGFFLRKTSLDELPQIWSILKGEMTFVGPRPALFNQEDLMKLRVEKGIDKLKPGLTGWAQINGRDDISIEQKVNLEMFYLENRSILFDFQILFQTSYKVIRQESIKH